MKNSIIGGGTAAVTATTGLSQILDLIPNDIGKIACLFGILASAGVITTQAFIVRLTIRNTRKINLEIKKMEGPKGYNQ